MSKSDFTLPPEYRERYNKHIHRHRQESDRGFAIVSAAIIDEHVRTLIQSRLKQNSAALKRLFTYPGPMATASACIDMGFVLGLYGEVTYTDLKIINRIRNTFAHEVVSTGKNAKTKPLTFRSQIIADQCGALGILLYFLKYRRTDATMRRAIRRIKTPRRRFEFTVAVMQFLLAREMYEKITPAKRIAITHPYLA